MRLTDLSIKSLKPPEKGEQIHYDETLTGFGVRVSEGGTKSYILTHGRRRTRETLGRVGIISLSDARGEAKRRLAEYTLGKHQPKAKSWSTAVSEFLAEPRKPRTQKDYKRHLAVHFPYGETRFSEITAHDLQKDLDKLSSTPGEREHAFVVLRAFIRWAHRRHYTDKNPMERMTVPRYSQPRERILTDEELVKVWKACGDDTHSRIVKLLILTGQRRGEITQLTGAMIGDGIITLPTWLTKNGREHSFPIGHVSQSIFTTSQTKATSTLIFNARRSKTLQSCFSGFSKSKVSLDEKSGVADWTLHDLRRTYASGLASLGVAQAVIERLLNHVSGSFAGVTGVYNRFDYMPQMKEAVALWEARITKLLEN